MTKTGTETIAAVATPPGQGGVGIIRISGPNALFIAQTLCELTPKPRQAHYVAFKDVKGQGIDQGLVLFFPGPHSFTGEDVIELQGHGGPVILDILLTQVLNHGARLARPGEFSERAYLNDKIDLAQAEAIADLIESGSEQAARAAFKSLTGEFSAHIHQLVERLIELRTYIEASLDFAEEEIDFLSDTEVLDRIDRLNSSVEALLSQTRQGALLKEGMTVVFCGEPNVGKSSLLNAVSGRDSAIVSSQPGTTRDIIREHVHLDGLPLHIIDTAGLRQSDDEIEQEGIRRARTEIEKADRILIILDNRHTHDPPLESLLTHYQLPTNIPTDLIYNKIDLTETNAQTSEYSTPLRLYVSAKTGEGLESLRTHLKKSVGFDQTTEGSFTARRRHLDSLRSAHNHIDLASEQLRIAGAGELAAEELRLAQQHLGEITGEFTSDDLLGRIFSSFCIGK
ncbi:MAG: tRNA uridine-5-carboxymethylaminomethyl(34) synthesis GTPase MnmE [Gammaproteobacteria bacterium]|nr:tRNA uridine-5-carboxymethylaminomethyl(34) synthesis GTPase MnmE [Gammaproteobacteria bacterium]